MACTQRFFGGIMRVGTLVKYCSFLGIVVGEWTHPISEEEHTLVRWVTGCHTGDTDAMMECDLEVLCE